MKSLSTSVRFGVCCATVLVFAAGCGTVVGGGADSAGATEEIASSDAQLADAVDAAAKDLGIVPDVPATADVPPAPDVPVTAPDITKIDGGCSEPGCACSEGGQCDSGFCIEAASGQQCAKSCGDKCADGFKCVQVTASSGDLLSLCVPAHPRICEPCAADSDCSNVLGGSDSRCVPYKDAAGSNLGYFCGNKCASNGDCAPGYSCKETASIGEIKGNQCIKDDLQCLCDVRATKLQLGTTCNNFNTAGTCSGKRGCGSNGLSSCDAKSAAPETCNKKDDNCDGQTDEAGAGVCDDGFNCTYDNCVGGDCQHPPKTGVCDDGSACTSGDECNNGKCVGKASTCDDKNPCTFDSCDGAKGCQNANDDAAKCSDDNVCTSDDGCKGGVCIAGNAMVCEDNNPCTSDTCDKKTGCVYAPNTLPCNDNNVCTLGDVCAASVCKSGGAVACNDGNSCTDDSCDAAKGCVFSANSASCTDGNVCTVGDACESGSCQPGEYKDCDDKNYCTTDSCETKKGCVHAVNTAPCDDSNPCTLADKCAAGDCKPGNLLSCDDGNPCTDDLCDGINGCKHSNNVAKCDDNNNCTSGDACKGGACIPLKASLCDDGNPCTTETCDQLSGACSKANNSALCDDGVQCTVADTCVNGACKGGIAVGCDDGNPCTDDNCDKVNGCLHINNAEGCTDNNVCTQIDYCTGGKCKPGTPLGCNDGNACTDDICSPSSGCSHLNNEVPCSDGNVCTSGDECSSGSCISGVKMPCNDGNACTSDNCDAVKGCNFVNSIGACDDSNGCTGGDVCANGQCKGVAACSANGQCQPGAQNVVCACKQGYGGDGFTCVDTNECLVNNGGCAVSATCTNLPGSYSCACNSGYLGDGKTCADIDECVNGSAGCSVNATCTNVPGSFACVCKKGYIGNGKTCADIDECANGTAGCGANALCTNTDGSFNCACKPGFTGDGFTCKVQICPANNQACDGSAVDLAGFSCNTLAANGYTKEGVYWIKPDANPGFQVSCANQDFNGYTIIASLTRTNGLLWANIKQTDGLLVPEQRLSDARINAIWATQGFEKRMLIRCAGGGTWGSAIAGNWYNSTFQSGYSSNCGFSYGSTIGGWPSQGVSWYEQNGNGQCLHGSGQDMSATGTSVPCIGNNLQFLIR